MTETDIYYTFSTIAQTLAGAIALMGAFFLYRMQTLTVRIIADSKDVMQCYFYTNDSPQFEMLHREGKYLEIYELSGRLGKRENGHDPMYERKRLKQGLDLKLSLQIGFYISMLLTIGLITTSIVILGYGSKLVCQSVLLFRISVIWFLLCMASYINLIRKSV